jgi:hypothetical protein
MTRAAHLARTEKSDFFPRIHAENHDLAPTVRARASRPRTNAP